MRCQVGPLAYRQSRHIPHPKETQKKHAFVLFVFFFSVLILVHVLCHICFLKIQSLPHADCVFMNSVFMSGQSICMGTRPVICRNMEIFQEQ